MTLGELGRLHDEVIERWLAEEDPAEERRLLRAIAMLFAAYMTHPDRDAQLAAIPDEELYP